MSTYRKEWDCCGSATETEAWEPDRCPFCAVPPAIAALLQAQGEPVVWMREGAKDVLHNFLFDRPDGGPWVALYTAQQSSDQVWNEAIEAAAHECVKVSCERNELGMHGSKDGAARCVNVIRSLKRPLQAQEPALICQTCGADRAREACKGDLLKCGMMGIAHSASGADKCTACHGNDGDMPCAYPGEGIKGCLRDKRLASTAAQAGEVDELPPLPKSWHWVAEQEGIERVEYHHGYQAPPYAIDVWEPLYTTNQVRERDAMWQAKLNAALSRAQATQPAQQAVSDEGLFGLALNVKHKKCHQAADAFWSYWNENGETHKRGYYESTWGAINAAIKMVGVVPHTYGGKIPASPLSQPAAAPQETVYEGNGKFPAGYCTDPNGVICAPAGKHGDFSFGYDTGYSDGLSARNDALGRLGRTAAAPVSEQAVPEGFILVPKERIQNAASHAKLAADCIVGMAKEKPGNMCGWLDDACTSADIAAGVLRELLAAPSNQSQGGDKP